MKPEEQRIAIAEACGWKWAKSDTEESWAWYDPKGLFIDRHHANGRTPEEVKQDMLYCLPEYLRNLNAMHEAVQQFRYPKGGTLWAKNHGHLIEIVARDREMALSSVSLQWEVENATAAQRAEAFLRTLELWTV